MCICSTFNTAHINGKCTVKTTTVGWEGIHRLTDNTEQSIIALPLETILGTHLAFSFASSVQPGQKAQAWHGWSGQGNLLHIGARECNPGHQQGTFYHSSNRAVKPAVHFHKPLFQKTKLGFGPDSYWAKIFVRCKDIFYKMGEVISDVFLLMRKLSHLWRSNLIKWICPHSLHQFYCSRMLRGENRINCIRTSS